MLKAKGEFKPQDHLVEDALPHIAIRETRLKNGWTTFYRLEQHLQHWMKIAR